MRKLIEMTHVSLGGTIGPTVEWAIPYLDEDHQKYAEEVLFNADALLLGRLTYQGLSSAYPAMPPNPFVDRMNAVPKHVASRTLRDAEWNAAVIDGDVVEFTTELKKQPGGDILKFGNGPLSALLMRHGLIDEFRLLLAPVALGGGQRLFEDVEGAPALELVATRQFASGALALTYVPASRA